MIRSATFAPLVLAGSRAPADPEALEALERGIRGADLAAPPVVLPDFVHKSRMEMPSSIAIATRGTIHPSFTASSLNCGMTLIALDAERPSVRSTLEFLETVRSRHPWPPGFRRSLATPEVLEAATKGAAFSLERDALDKRALERIEENGAVSLEPYGGATALREEIPWLARVLAGMRYASVGPSNHFVELQRVEHVFDPAAASELGLAAGMTTVQFHGGGGVLAGLVGRLFARRTKTPRATRLVMAVQKPGHHLARARSVAQARERLALYFREGAAIPREGDEGRRVMLAHAAAMNFGFAFRASIYGSIGRIARLTLGCAGARLVVDSPHNSIYEEDGALVHRHNSCRVWPAERFAAGSTFSRTGGVVLLPGTHRTSSYVCAAGPAPERSLYSASHGSGAIIADLVARGISTYDPAGRHTIRLGYERPDATLVAQLDDRGVDEALSILVRFGIVRPIARLRPLGVLH